MTHKTPAAVPPVVKTVLVQCSPKQAFGYFVHDFNRWWPVATHSCIAKASNGSRAPVSCTFEPKLGGKIYECGDAGEKHVWGTVVVWEPPSRVAFSWHPGRNPATAQKVEVVFTPDAKGTRVVLTHTEWERLGDDSTSTRQGYDTGWETVFVRAFVEYANSRTH